MFSHLLAFGLILSFMAPAFAEPGGDGLEVGPRSLPRPNGLQQRSPFILHGHQVHPRPIKVEKTTALRAIQPGQHPHLTVDQKAQAPAALPKPVDWTTSTPTKSETKAPPLTPVTKMTIECASMREQMLMHKYTPAGSSQPVSLEAKHEIFETTLPHRYWQNCVKYRGERIFLQMDLFDPQHTFLMRDGENGLVWVSNHERMERGLAPICYRAHQEAKPSPDSLTQEEVRAIVRRQREFTIELHHMDQRMGGYGLLMVVPGLHRGGAAGFYVDFSGDSPKILQAQLSQEEMAGLKKTKEKRVVCDVMHTPREPGIDRAAFGQQRTDIWKGIARRSPSIRRVVSRSAKRGKPSTAIQTPLFRSSRIGSPKGLRL